MKTKIYVGSLAVMMGAWCVLVDAQIPLDAPVANLTERWDTSSSGWVASDPLSGWTNQAMLFKCNTKADYGTYVTIISGATNSSAGHYVGDFSKIDAVSFDVIPKLFAVNPNFYFKAKSGAKWRTQFGAAVSGQPDGVAVNVVLPFTYSANWWSDWPDAEPGVLASHFATDAANVVELGFEFVRFANDTAAMQLAIDNLKLVGPWTGPFTNGVPIAWVLENGLPTSDLANIGSADSDGDHFSNAAEFLAGTDPTNAASFFAISIERNSAGQMVVKWKGNQYVTYDLLEANSLGEGQSFTPKVTNITTLSSEVETNVGDAGSAQHFYKVQINSKN